MSKLVIEYLKHLRDEFNYLSSASEKISKDEFLQNETLKRSFTRSLEIMGEAAKNLPDEFRRKHKHIDWKSIAGMRDKLIHHYFGIDYEIVWDVVINEVPKLEKGIRKIGVKLKIKMKKTSKEKIISDPTS